MKAVESNKYDIIFMDIGLPDMKGYTLTTLIDQNYNILNSTPVIAFTANAFDSARKKCIASGMRDIITKPISEDVLLRVLEKFCPMPSNKSA